MLFPCTGNKVLAVALPLTMFLAGPALATAELESDPTKETVPAQSQSNVSNETATEQRSAEEIAPQKNPAGNAAVAPPLVPERPELPAPSTIPALPARNNQYKPPLSWRARAYQLSLSLSDAAPASSAITRTFSANKRDTLSALIKAAKGLNLRIEGLSKSAGQVLLAPDTSGPSLIVVLKQLASSKTIIKIGTLSERRTPAKESCDSIFAQIETNLNERGLL